jgi:flagellar secretion chaperone FliS
MDAIQAYRESEITGDNPVHLVVLLYDQLLRDLRHALDAFEQRDIPRRCRELDHALVVIAQLQGSLNLQDGGDVAQILDRFYGLLRDDLLRASIGDSPALIEKRWRNILSVREAWLEVERQQNTPAPKPATSHAVGDEANGKAERNSGWKV